MCLFLNCDQFQSIRNSESTPRLGFDYNCETSFFSQKRMMKEAAFKADRKLINKGTAHDVSPSVSRDQWLLASIF